ncbi:hypothetical protein HHUSO_G34632 [Huso huso]|uniref:Ig-like domain-containing protein n=1 Tax=Huso huso TaxID=61971 RepID=A0ABR0Y4R3_HUSHU
MVTVTSATPSPPTVFPLVASCGLSDATGPLTMGCLATDFLPTPVTFSWTDQSGKAISSDKYRQYPSVQNGGTYTSTSQLSISNAEWEKSEYFTCTVENASGKKHTQVNKPAVENTTPPHVFIIPPSSEELRANKTATIVCVARGFAPKDYTFKWFTDSKEFDASHYINTDAVEDKGYFDASSLLTVKEDEWKGSSMIKCELAHGRVTVSRNISSSAPDCSQCSATVDVHVEILPPTPEEILTQKGATLTCKATGLASQHNIKMVWSSPEDVQELASGTPVVTVVEGYITAVYEYKADLQKWASGNKFICTVTPDKSLQSPKSIEYHRVIIKGDEKAPEVFLLSPSPQETTKGHSEVTVTCYVKDFYPEDVYISWLHSDKTVASDRYTSTNLIPKKNENGASSFSVYSKLTMPRQSWVDGDVYTCVVHHETIQTLTKTITRNTDSAGACTAVSQDCSDYDSEEDDVGSLWTTASTFIFLFLASFFYSIGATFAKVKWCKCC